MQNSFTGTRRDPVIKHGETGLEACKDQAAKAGGAREKLILVLLDKCSRHALYSRERFLVQGSEQDPGPHHHPQDSLPWPQTPALPLPAPRTRAPGTPARDLQQGIPTFMSTEMGLEPPWVLRMAHSPFRETKMRWWLHQSQNCSPLLRHGRAASLLSFKLD